MAEISFQGKTFEVDEDGFLLRFDDWCPEWMEFVKESEGIAEITADHQKILDFLQDYYKKNGIAPMVRILSKNTGYKLKEVYELFPSGPGKGACKMAGLPKPTGCVWFSALLERRGFVPPFPFQASPPAGGRLFLSRPAAPRALPLRADKKTVSALP